MTTVINFKCGACGKPYSVKPDYAGREFACKQCGTQLCVPQPGQGGVDFDAQVEMGSGSEVMRKTTASGRQLPTDPTRVFRKHRETSARMVAVPADAEAAEKKSSKLPLLIVVVVLLLGGGVGAAFALGVFDSGTPVDGGQKVATNEPDAGNADGTAQEPDERAEIFTELDAMGSDSAKLIALYDRAEQAGLEKIDLATIGRRVVSAMLIDRGGVMPDAQLLSFAAKLEDIDESGEAMEIYKIVIQRNRGSDEQPESVTQAHEALGHHHIDFTPQVMRAAELRDYGVHEDLPGLHDELVQMDGRSDDGWVLLDEKDRFEQIVKRLDEAAADIERLKTEDPFFFEVASAKQRFSNEAASRRGTWFTFAIEPYVLFCQVDADDEDDARDMLVDPLTVTKQYYDFFRKTFVEPLELQRALPSDVPEGERHSAPYEILLFRNPSEWGPYIRPRTLNSVDSSKAKYFIEPGSGRASMVFQPGSREEEDQKNAYIEMLAAQVFHCHHANAPTTKEEDKDFKILKSFFLANSVVRATLYRRVSGRGAEAEYFFWYDDDNRIQQRLKQWNSPFSQSDQGGISAIGGVGYSVQDLVEITTVTQARDRLRETLLKYEGWDETNLNLILGSQATVGNVVGSYLWGLCNFLYYWSPDGGEPKYRDKFLSYIKMDLEDKVDGQQPHLAFLEAFELGDDWSDIEKDWLAYQTDE